MDDDMKQLRVRFSRVGQEDQVGRETITRQSRQNTSFSSGLMSNGEEYDAAYAAMVAAVAYAIAVREGKKLASQQMPGAEKFASGNKRRLAEKLGSQKKPVSVDERPALKSQPREAKASEGLLKPAKFQDGLVIKNPLMMMMTMNKEVYAQFEYNSQCLFVVPLVLYHLVTLISANISVRRPLRPAQKKPEGIASVDERQTAPTLKSPTKRDESLKKPIEGSKISRWFSGKEPVDDDYDGEQGENVLVRRPLQPAQKKPAEGITSGQNVVEKVIDSAPSLKKNPSFTRKPTKKKGSRKFEQDQEHKMVPPAAPTPKPMSSYSGRWGRVAASGMATSSEAEAMANAWEKEKMAKIMKQYNETMETIAEWEAEKKAKARRQKQLKEESDSEMKRANALEEYNGEMSRINKVAAASKLTAEKKRRNTETKVREKADKIWSTGRLPSTCGCF